MFFSNQIKDFLYALCVGVSQSPQNKNHGFERGIQKPASHHLNLFLLNEFQKPIEHRWLLNCCGWWRTGCRVSGRTGQGTESFGADSLTNGRYRKPWHSDELSIPVALSTHLYCTPFGALRVAIHAHDSNPWHLIHNRLLF
jgi:hypothetical protein